MIGGGAKGNLAAEKYVMGSSNWDGSVIGGERFVVPSLNFSGIDKNEGIPYL